MIKLRKILAVLVCLLLALTIFSCADTEPTHGPTGPNEEDTSEITGRYLRAGTSDFIICTDTSHTPIHIENGSSWAFMANQVNIGDLIRFTVGPVMESWPEKAEVYGYEIISSGTLDDIDAEILKKLEELGYKVTETDK